MSATAIIDFETKRRKTLVRAGRLGRVFRYVITAVFLPGLAIDRGARSSARRTAMPVEVALS
jgi:hypothetical protein